MKRWYIPVIIAGLACLLSGACSSRKSSTLAGNFNTTDKHIRNGQEKYMQYCQHCHPGGEAGLGPSINANKAPGFVKRFQVRHGLGAMPAFKKEQLSKSDLKDIMRYLKALQRE